MSMANNLTPRDGFLVTPSDSTELPSLTERLRLNVTVAGNVVVVTEAGTTLTLAYPVGLFVEELAVRQVKSTGTTATATIHGLF